MNNADVIYAIGPKLYESALISGYSAMFHTGRALLFKDGYQEKSHYAVYVFIKERYGGILETKYLTELNSLRIQRHEVMYGIEEEKRKEIDEVEAEEIISTAKGFLKVVKQLVEESG